MRKPSFNMSIFKERRRRLCQMPEAKGGAIVLPSHPDFTRNHDVHHPYRQDSNFFYLTGFEEPGSVLVIRPGQNPETVMFVRPKDVERETWDGFRYGPEAAQREFLVDACYLISEFEEKIVELLKPVDKVFYRWDNYAEFDQTLIQTLTKVRTGLGRTGRGQLAVHDAWELIGEMRVRKSADEADVMREACRISSLSHIEAMKFVKPGVNERVVQGQMMATAYLNGATREGYNYIVASGNNATTLHYNFNDQECKDGELILIDVGFEKDYYTGDITRTFPVGKKFSGPQRDLYQGVLDVQKRMVAITKPGLAFKTFQEMAIDQLTDLMLHFKLLKGVSKAEIVEKALYRKYYPHGAGHFLGLDVHDSGLYFKNGEPRLLESGMCFTIEPGIYVPAGDMSAPEAYRGIGIRIEDNILVTESGFDNMTAMCPKEIPDIESLR